LWSPDSPNCYSCELTLTSAAGTMTCKETFGFRHFEFVEKGAFKLNGERLLIRGTHRHEDHAGLAAAMPEHLIIKEMQMMKDMGVNFIRLAHYQQSRIVLEQCDRLGFLAWEEIPWCRGGLGGEAYRVQAKRMLENMITQHRNHPAVILWGLGNENDWPNDFPTFDKEAIRAFMKELHNLAHRLDNTRLTCIRRCDFCKDIVDVYSPSIWAGWYRGVYTDYKKVSYDEMQQVKRFLHVEWGGDSHALRHDENTYEGLESIKSEGNKADEREGDASLHGGIARASRDSNWSETYICDLIDWHLKEQETMTWLSGAAYWPFKDFSTPVRPENPAPYMNQKGVVERDLTKKEAYYVFQSYWTEKPMAHIYGHSWPVRWGGKDEKRMLKVYSNCEQVELFLNGTSLGVKKRNPQDFPAAGLRWETCLIEGKNTVKAVATKGKGKNAATVEDEISFDYQVGTFGKESAIKLTATDAGSGEVWVGASLIDGNGLLCLTSRKYIRFDSTGDGELIVNRGTSTGSKYVQAYNGRAKVKLRKNGGKSVVSVKVEGLKTAFINVD
jgi:beta-galactosidase